MNRAVPVLGLFLAAAAAAETVEWDRTPIPVTLAVGVERQVGRKFGKWLDVASMQLLL